MALEATFRRFCVALHRLHEAVAALQTTLGDTPANDETAMADVMENNVFDIVGTLNEIRQAALHAQKSVHHPPDLGSARQALALCQERFHSVERQFASDLVSYKSLTELARLAKERRPWIPWTRAVRKGIEQCCRPLEQTSKALSACWQELAEHLGAVNISLKTTNVGQHVTSSNSKLEDRKIESAR